MVYYKDYINDFCIYNLAIVCELCVRCNNELIHRRGRFHIRKKPNIYQQFLLILS